MQEGRQEATKVVSLVLNSRKKKKKQKKLQSVSILRGLVNPCPAEPGYTLPLQTV